MVYVYPSTPSQTALRVPYYTLHIISAVLLFGLLVVFVLQKKKRNPTLVNLIVALVIDSSLHCVILGQDENPSTAVAIVSTVCAISGILATLGSFAALIFRMWAIVCWDISTMFKWERTLDRWLVVLPWAFCLSMVVGSSVAASLHPDQIEVVVFGAYTRDGRVTYVSRAFAALFLLIAVVCEGLTIAVCVRRPSRLKPENDNSQTTSDSQFAIKSLLDAGFTIRALSFGIYASVGIVFAVVSLISNSPAPAFYQAVAGIVVFLVFGSQRDILHFVNVLSPPLNSTSRVLRSASRVDVRIERHVKIDPPAFHSEIQASVNRGTGGGTSGDGSEISMHTVESGKEGGEESAESQVDLVTLPTMGQTWDSR